MEGQKQPRMCDRFLVHISAVYDPRLAETVCVENLGARGARVATARSWEPGSHVALESNNGDLRARARVVYCRPIGAKGLGFAVRLDFITQTNGRSEPATLKERNNPRKMSIASDPRASKP